MKVNRTLRFLGEGAETRILDELSSRAPQMANASPTVLPLPLEAVRKTVSVFALWIRVDRNKKQGNI